MQIAQMKFRSPIRLAQRHGSLGIRDAVVRTLGSDADMPVSPRSVISPPETAKGRAGCDLLVAL